MSLDIGRQKERGVQEKEMGMGKGDVFIIFGRPGYGWMVRAMGEQQQLKDHGDYL